MDSLRTETSIDDPLATLCVSRAIGAMLDERGVVFACIGTDRSTGDALGPLVGDRLRMLGAEVIGTLERPLHALNLSERLGGLGVGADRPLVVAIDAALGPRDRVGAITIRGGGIDPGCAMGKRLPAVGDISITATVNVATATNRERVLQSTRLFFVARVAEVIATGCDDALSEHRRLLSARAA